MNRLFSGIGSKIILPYLLLTLLVAGVGAYIVVNLVTGTLQERFNNQLLDAGRVVAESMVGFEAERLTTLRQIAFTEGVVESVVAADRDQLDALVPQIIINSPHDAVVLLNSEGVEVYSWQRLDNLSGTATQAETDLSQLPDVQQVLSGYMDEYGDKRVLLAETPSGPVIYTVGPIFLGEAQVGAILVGTDVRKMTIALTQNAIARVTLYAPDGRVIFTALGDGRENVADILENPPTFHAEVQQRLQASPSLYQVVTQNATEQVPLHQVEVLNQKYQLAFGDWRLRNESFGLFSVALPSNFIVTAAATSRTLLNLVFTVATVGVILIGFWTARRIVHPLNRLVDVTTAVTEGNLNQRTGIRRRDEIGTLALSFDVMTERLDERNRQLVAQKSELAAILHSIADGVIMLDGDDNIVEANPAAQQLLADVDAGTVATFLHEILNQKKDAAAGRQEEPHRLEVDHRVLSASVAPVQTPEGVRLGTVMVLRDITREAEAESLKDDFITGMSHELRTPLTVLKVYTDLMKRTANGHLEGQQYGYLEKIAKAGGELEAHIQKMISISEIQAGNLSLKKADLAFNEQLEQIVATWQPEMEKRQLKFEVELPELPVTVFADAGRIRWALDNVLSNACHYTPEGGSVHLTARRTAEKMLIEVRDTGIGINAADQPYVFDRFFRAKNENNYNQRGIGLGLYIARELILAHNGRINLQSQAGTGTTVQIELPLITEAATAVAAVEE